MNITVHFQADTCMKFLRDSLFKIILRIGLNVTYPFPRANGVVAYKTSKQGILDRWRREEAIVGGVNDSRRLRQLICEADSRTRLHTGPNEVKMIVAYAEIHPQIAKGREVIL